MPKGVQVQVLSRAPILSMVRFAHRGHSPPASGSGRIQLIVSTDKLLHESHRPATPPWHNPCNVVTEKGECDMKTSKQTESRMLKLALAAQADVDYVNAAAALIRELPDVLRVRVDLSARQLEILYRSPALGMLQSIHQCLLLAGKELLELRAY